MWFIEFQIVTKYQDIYTVIVVDYCIIIIHKVFMCDSIQRIVVHSVDLIL